MTKTVLCLCLLSTLACGCARRSELEAARRDLAAAQREISALHRERVPRGEFEAARASLRVADRRIGDLEQDLAAARAQAALLEAAAATPAPAGLPGAPRLLTLARGTWETSDDTLVYSPDAQLNFGDSLQISSPTGLLVTDPELRVVGGDLSIRAKGMTLETSDGLLAAEPDGSVHFTGSSLTMRFDPAEPAAPANPDQTAARPTADPAHPPAAESVP